MSVAYSAKLLMTRAVWLQSLCLWQTSAQCCTLLALSRVTLWKDSVGKKQRANVANKTCGHRKELSDQPDSSDRNKITPPFRILCYAKWLPGASKMQYKCPFQ